MNNINYEIKLKIERIIYYKYICINKLIIMKGWNNIIIMMMVPEQDKITTTLI